MQKGFTVFYLVVGLLILGLIVGGAYWLGTKKDQTVQQARVNQPTSSSSTQNNTDQYNSSDLNGFSAYPGATFVKKEKQPACEGEVSGFSTCNTTTYTWQTKDDYDQVSSWYREDKSNSGWKCSGGAGSYDGPRSSSGKTTCRKGGFTYDLSLTADATKTEIVLQIPYKNISQDETSSWKTFTTAGINSGLTIKYPQEWVTPENMFISEKTFVAGEQDRSKVYNIIEIQKYSTQLYVGYTNSEWFNKISNLTEPMSDQRETRTKIISGNIASGESYVIFKDEPSATFQGGAFKQVKAYILKDQTIYQLTLDLYDSNGLEVFKKIVSSATVK